MNGKIRRMRISTWQLCEQVVNGFCIHKVFELVIYWVRIEDEDIFSTLIMIQHFFLEFSFTDDGRLENMFFGRFYQQT